MKVWLVVEQDEDHGTDCYTIQSAWATEESAKREVERIIFEHGYSVDDGEYVDKGDDEGVADVWCICHRKDWAVEGPFEVKS